MVIKTDAASFQGSAREEDPGSTPVSGVGESVSLSRTSAEQNSFRRDAETHARDGRAPRFEDARYSKRRLPHFEKPWAVYAVTITTRRRKTLSPCARTIVLNGLIHFHNSRYELFAACIMPDHAHLLFQPWPKGENPSNNAIFWSIPELMHSLKSFTAHEINKVEKSRGPVWEEEIFDRYIRSESDLQEKFCYICRNP
jgi:putative transposase